MKSAVSRLLRDRFGSVDEAREVLNSLTAVLNELDEGTLDEPATDGRRTTSRPGDGARRSKGNS